MVHVTAQKINSKVKKNNTNLITAHTRVHIVVLNRQQTTLRRALLIIFPLSSQTNVKAQMLEDREGGLMERKPMVVFNCIVM